MTRESKNNNDGAVFTYHERRIMQHGTARLRLPAASMKPWHHCALRLSQPEAPVITPHGVLYDREAIILNLLQQKQRIRQQRVQHRLHQNRHHRERVLADATRRQEDEARFAETQTSVHVNHPTDAHASEETPDNPTLVSNFWLPVSDDIRLAERSHPAKRRRKDQPNRTLCPVTAKPLKSRDLITLKPTLLKTETVHRHTEQLDAKPSAPAPDVLYMCPVCQTALLNAAKPFALRTGTVICKRCADDFVRNDSHDPITGAKLDVERDLIQVQNSGTAFAASSSDDPGSKEATLYRPSVR